jgi:hypothetical protein
MDGIGSTLPVIIPVTSAFIFISLSCVQGLMDTSVSIRNQPRSTGGRGFPLLVPLHRAGIRRLSQAWAAGLKAPGARLSKPSPKRKPNNNQQYSARVGFTSPARTTAG